MSLDSSSYWLNKANIFSLLVLTLSHPDDCRELGPDAIKAKLLHLENNLPKEYADAAKEGVNNKKERIVRHNTLVHEILGLTT